MHLALFIKVALVAVTLTSVQAHSWVELIRNIASDGSFIGNPGYPRGWQNRSLPSFSDLPETWQIENLHGSNPNLCAPGEQDASSQGSVPRLQATPGSPIALLYQENGHVTIPSNNPAKPANRGTVYIYATQQPKAGEKYYDVYQQWNVAGNGGDGRGKLISTQNFDDGRCFQINGGAISQARQAANKFTPSAPMGSNLWCQNNIIIPHDMDTSKLVTLYWVWKWDDLPHVDPKVWNGQNQTYTSCMDIALTPASGSKKVRKFAYNGGQSPQNAALGNVFNKLASGNIFAVSAYIDGMSPTPTGTPSSVTYSIVPASPAASTVQASTPTVQASTSAMTSGCSKKVITSTETVFVFGTSTGTVAPTGTDLSFSTISGTMAITSASQTNAALPSSTGMLVTELSDGQPEAPAPTSGPTSIVSQISDGQPQAPTSISSTGSIVSQISDGQPQAPTPISSSTVVSQISDGQPQAPATTSAAVSTQSTSPASTSAAASSISDNPVVVPVPTNPTASFTFMPSVTQTVSPIASSSAAPSSGATVSTLSGTAAGTTSLVPSAAATSAASSTVASSSPSSSTGPCKAASAKKQSKIFAPIKAEQAGSDKAVRNLVDRGHARHWY